MRRRTRGSIPALLAAAALAIGTPGARAQEARDPVAAEALFLEALELMKAGNYASACPKLQTSLRLDPGVGVLLYLGECHERIGRVASAWAAFREAEAAAREGAQDRRAAMARDRIALLEPRLPRLTIAVDPAARIDGLEVRRDGAIVGETLWGTALPVDPGAVRVEASAPGHRPFTVGVTMAEGRTAAVTVPPLDREPAIAPTLRGPSADVAPTVQPQPMRAKAAAGFAGLGFGAAALGLAATGAALSLREGEPWGDFVPVAVGGGAAAALGLGGGAALLLTEPKDARPAFGTRAVAMSLVGVGVAGLATGATAGALALGYEADLTDACGGGGCPESERERVRAFETSRLVAIVGLALGGVGIGAGTAWFLASRDGAAAGPTVNGVSLAPLRGGSRVGFGGVF